MVDHWGCSEAGGKLYAKIPKREGWRGNRTEERGKAAIRKWGAKVLGMQDIKGRKELACLELYAIIALEPPYNSQTRDYGKD